MPLSIQVDLPHLPKGEVIGIPGLGRFVNGGDAVEIDPETERAFVQTNGMHVREALDQDGISISGTRSASDDDVPEEPAPVEGTRHAEEGDLVETNEIVESTSDLDKEGED